MEWGLNILNGVHNHVMEPTLEGYMIAGRLKEDDKKIVRDLTKSKVHPRKYFDKFEEQKTTLHDKYQASI